MSVVTSKPTPAIPSVINKATYTWVINDIASKKRFELSPSFTFPNNRKICFSLCLQVNKSVPFSKTKYFVVHLYMSQCDRKELPLRYRLSILDVKMQKRNERVYHAIFSTSDLSQALQQQIFQRDYLLNVENGLLVEGKVTFHCEIEITENRDLGSVYNKALWLQNSKNYEALLDSGKWTDVSLKISDQELKAHKSILSAQSPVFAAMFENECKESQENVVRITDVSVGVFQELLRFLYSGKTPDLNQFAPELLAAADKYQLTGLRSVCAQFLASKLDVESVAGTLLLADLHSEAELKSKCITFFAEHGAQVMVTDGWKRLMATNRMDLLVELLQKTTVKD